MSRRQASRSPACSDRAAQDDRHEGRPVAADRHRRDHRRCRGGRAVHPTPINLTYDRLVDYTQTPQKILLPVLGILAITSEWSQRTGLVTFTLAPNRGRVLLAKVTATVILGLVVIAASSRWRRSATSSAWRCVAATAAGRSARRASPRSPSFS